MKRIIFTAVLGLSVLAMHPAQAAAQASSAVTLSSEIMLVKTVLENGTEKKSYVEPKVVVPGDQLLFAVNYRNNGSAVVEGFVLTNPLPSAVMLASDSAGKLEVSVDGGKTWGKLAALTVNDTASGPRAAQAGDVTHVRWALAPLAPGASGSVTFNAIVR